MASINWHEGFRWISRKHYYSKKLNPKDPPGMFNEISKSSDDHRQPRQPSVLKTDPLTWGGQMQPMSDPYRGPNTRGSGHPDVQDIRRCSNA